LYSKAFDSVRAGYRIVIYFISVIEKIRSPSEDNSFSFSDIEFHEVNSTPTLYTFVIRLQQSTIGSGIYGTKNFNIGGE
jgi:hypothetical protein